MLNNKTIICISSIDWDFIWQGHQEIMSKLAGSGNTVLFVDNTGVRSARIRDISRVKRRLYNWIHSIKGIKQLNANLYRYSPLILPFPYSKVALALNTRLIVPVIEKWIRSVGGASPVFWTFLPTPLVFNIIEKLNPKLTVYHCVDDFSSSSNEAKRVSTTEKKIMSLSDLVFVTSNKLYNKASSYNENVHLFSSGVDLDKFKLKDNKTDTPNDIADKKKPVVGYVGGIHKWIDFEILKKTARSNRDKSFVFVGPVQTSTRGLENEENVFLLGQKEYGELPRYINSFDVCLVPYRITDYTDSVYPVKLTEYLAMGKPVVSTDILEVRAFQKRNPNILNIARDASDFSQKIDQAIQNNSPEKEKIRKAKAFSEGDWNSKIEKMSALILGSMEKKEKKLADNWKENILKIYRKTSRKLLVLSSLALIFYLVLMKTPLLWWMAQPLMISDRPEKADAIVVLAGGVGESGKPGQGTEERVRYAIDLYEEGFADDMIFSSGYTNIFKEPEVMKAIAVSLNVPEKHIILEEQATNTFENVVNTKRILQEKGFDSVIFVSSPYHMRRIFLVAQKELEDTKVYYCPVPNTLYYGDRKKVLWKHIKSILHEYLGILYYKIRRMI